MAPSRARTTRLERADHPADRAIFEAMNGELHSLLRLPAAGALALGLLLLRLAR
jgi:hypothetical protein